jgi:hypothetical protein
MRKYAALLALLITTGTVQAHHGSNSQFDQTKSMEISGVVTKLRFVNPHSYVYFDVTNDDGTVDNWRCEMRAATVLKRSGWSRDMFEPGTVIHIEGVPARREPQGCYVNRLRLGEGAVIERYEQLDDTETAFEASDRPTTLANGQPNITGDWAAPQRLLQEGEVRRRAVTGFGGFEFPQSEAGQLAATNFDLNRDNPRYHCKPVNILADWVFDQHINRIEQTDDSITLTYGFMDIVRTIHLGLDKHPDNVTPSRAGHSIGHWEGNTLLVDTIGFTPGYLDGRAGVMHSDQLHVVEEFQFDPDELALVRSYTGDDPLYLSESFSRRDAVFLSETPFDPYNCDDLTTEFVEGH